MHLSAPSSIQETLDWQTVEANADPDVGIHEETQRAIMRVRGVEMVPSGDVPNIPTSTPPNRAVSPKIRHDMFRRKESPGSGGSGGSK
ncbi:unnamed protein product [Nippostrongylus brasiliensis]|uniref:Anaphase-promoting complex subunit 13 n=1 Tax=Nippostrongylus brasiliensis TaxID=27835 RepID=A0A0N4YGS2_NIPBR|nr:unnamed protein product [Nippostrongylus brasiliensis]